MTEFWSDVRALPYSSPVVRPRIERPEPIEAITTKLPRSVIRQMRLRATKDDITVQDFVLGAVTRELARRDRLEARRTTPQS